MGSSAHLRKGLATRDVITIIQIFYNYDSRVTFPLDVLRIDLIAILPSGIGILGFKIPVVGDPSNFKGRKRFITWNGGVLPTERTGTESLRNVKKASRCRNFLSGKI